MHGNHILVTGGFGNLGSYIAKHLISLNYEVTILTRSKKNKFENLKCRVVECDITNLDELKLKLNYDFDYCIHCASFNESFLENYAKSSLDINAFGTRNLIESLNIKKLKNFIYLSTFHVYGLSDGVIDEKTLPNPRNDYASTHLFAEFYVKQFGFNNNLQYTILRLTNGYGVPSFKNTDKWYLVLNELVKMSFEKEKIVLSSNGKAKRDMIYMKDAANVVEKLLKVEATNEIYNLSSNKAYEILDLAKKVQRIFYERYNKRVEIEVNKNDFSKSGALSVDNKKLMSIINFKINNEINNEINKTFDLLEST